MQSLPDRIHSANALLAPSAVPHGTQLGREHEEAEDATRFPFQRDRDRIIHSQAFRRLKAKTQVFIAERGDHYRTRLTHTMEVAQISRDMARTLSLNEDLAECIALAHDLGHTPFGHAGEDAMREEMEQCGGTFEHNMQSLRIVTVLEERTSKYAGLNLNREVLEGLMKHRTSYDAVHGDLPRAPSLEAQIVNLADEIAYTAHDTDDGLRANLLTHEELLTIPLYDEAFAKTRTNGTEVRGTLIHLLVMDAYAETERRLAAGTIRTLDDVYNAATDLVAFSDTMTAKLSSLRIFLHEQFYSSKEVRGYSEEGMRIIQTLFRKYKEHPPEKVLALQKRTGGTLPKAIKDYIAGMTDAYAAAMAGDT
ncbi:MAG TPA: dNTP triphosphohydrolase [Candidatus Peribacterales bacterium]|nr:dNTP triphosphohydrolase [Candidatus Peribacterales bacterium]